MCGTAVTSSSDPLGRGLALSIAFMLAVPNLLVASIGGWLLYVYRRASRAGWGARAQDAVSGTPAAGDAGRATQAAPAAGPAGPHIRENGRE